MYVCGVLQNTYKMAKKQLKSGRKRLPDDEKKIGVTLYIKRKTVKKYGGRTGMVNEISNRIEPLLNTPTDGSEHECTGPWDCQCQDVIDAYYGKKD